MKRFVSVVLSFICAIGLFCFAGCGPSGTDENDGYIEQLGDPMFRAGITVDSTGTGNDGSGGREIIDYNGTAEGDIYWGYAQYNCRLSTRNGKEIKEGDWYIYTDSENDNEVSKRLRVNPTTGQVALDCDASKDYLSPRTSPTDPWVHMLLTQGFYNSPFVSELDELILDISFTITKCENKTGVAYNPNLHAAQLQLFFVVKSSNQEEINDGMWFGMPFFDNRVDTLLDTSGNFDRGTNMYISSMGTKQYMTEVPQIGKKVHIRHNLLPEIQTALERAQSLGYMQQSTFDDLYLYNLNMGWEIPGVFDVGVTIDNFNLLAKYKEEA